MEGAESNRDARAEATRMLSSTVAGDASAASELLERVYGELRHLAGAYLARERQDHTLQPTALVHEAYLRMIDQEVEWKGNAHFVGVAAQAMRRILVDHARGVNRAKRGGGWRQVELRTDVPGQHGEPGEHGAEAQSVDLVALDEALAELAAQSPRRSRVVELRFFGGLELEAIAELTGVSVRTVKRDWRFSRAWLMERLEAEP